MIEIHHSPFTIHHSNVVIIGAGPAGITAAIQLKRYGIDSVLLEKGEAGGLLKNANLVENYPGFPDGISGVVLTDLFKKQLETTGVTVSVEKVTGLDYHDGMFFTVTDHRIIQSNITVIASGTQPKKLCDPPVSDDISERILYEIYPILDIEGRTIVIIGAGDAAFDYALNLSRKNDVVILNRSEQTKCLTLLKDRCLRRDTVTYSSPVRVQNIANDTGRLVLNCSYHNSNDEFTLNADYVVASIGREPCLDFLGVGLKKHFENLLNNHTLYMIGDVHNDLYRQTAICAGDGVKAAMQIYDVIGRKDI